MKHIEKDNNKIPAVYAKELKEKGLDEASIQANPTLTDTGAQLYDQIRAMDSYAKYSDIRWQGNKAMCAVIVTASYQKMIW